MNRYFFASYITPAATGITGMITLSCDKFPPNKLLKEKAQKICHDHCVWVSVDAIVITNLFEFKNEEDYDSFRDENYMVNEVP
jgi:hypothetical protein